MSGDAGRSARDRSRAGTPPPGNDPPGDPVSVARTICLTQLTQRARTRSELASTLARRGVPEDAANAVLDRFTDLGLINDAELADSYALAQHREKGLARRAVAQKLRKRGIDEQVVRDSVAAIDADSERAAAQRLVAKRLPAVRGLAPPARVRRLTGMLARRGYPADIATSVVREALAADDDLGADSLLPGSC